jgi:UDP-2,4-diacetamido-2,4,6-trideoxy-beta-L-altropyranose hydrolase
VSVRRVAFRADASLAIGTGHVMRCLALADALRARGAQCRFVCRAHPGHLGERIEAAGHALHLLEVAPAVAPVAFPPHAGWLGARWEDDAQATAAALDGWDPDWLVVDHYALDARWESQVAGATTRVLAIDDLADRAHACAILLDQGTPDARFDYGPWLPAGCRRLLGPGFALLRPEFARDRARVLARRAHGALRHVLVAMGGVDLPGSTSDVLDALDGDALPAGIRASVVLGAQAPALAAVVERAATLRFPCAVLTGVADMAALMDTADLAIGAGGMTALERCARGLPTIVVPIADNQRRGARALAEAGAGWLLASPKRIADDLPALLAGMSPAHLAAASVHAAALVDGRGTERVCTAMAS